MARQKSSDTFTTISGKTMSRKQLQNLVSKANYKIEHSKEHLTEKEYKQVKEHYAAQAKGLGMTEGKLSIKDVTDKRKLRAIEAAARHTLQSHYVQKSKYKQIEKKRLAEFQRKGYVTNEDQYKLLQELFRSKAWAELRESGYASSDQMLQSLQDDVLAEGAQTDQAIEGLQAVINGFALLNAGKGLEDLNPAMEKGTWEDFESTALETSSGTWYDDEEENVYFIPNVDPGAWANADEEERSEIMVEALADYMR